jgi:hypothetical protein
VQRFQRAIRKTQTAQAIDFDLAGTEREPRPSVAKLGLGSVAGAAGDGAMKGTGAAVKGTAKLTGALVRLGVRATRMASKAAAPHVKAGGSRIAR